MLHVLNRNAVSNMQSLWKPKVYVNGKGRALQRMVKNGLYRVFLNKIQYDMYFLDLLYRRFYKMSRREYKTGDL